MSMSGELTPNSTQCGWDILGHTIIIINCMVLPPVLNIPQWLNMRLGLKEGIRNMSKVKKGDRFGKLTVIKFHDRVNYRSYWKCLCDCYSNTMNVIVREDHLLSGHTKSCGCLRRKNALKQRSKI